MKHKLIILDLGNVLINFNHWVAANKLLRFSSKNLNDIHDLVFDSPLLKNFEEGRIEGEDFFLAVKNELKLDIDYNQFLPIWNEIFYLTPDNLGVYQLAQDLRKNYKIIVLSNINRLHFEYIEQNFRIFTPFDKTLLSKVSPQQAFYIDDRLDLIEAAACLSIPGTQFKSPRLFKVMFRRRWHLRAGTRQALN